MKSLSTAAIALIMSAGAAMADCAIWAFEDSSSGSQARAKVFASSDLMERDQLVAEAHGIATREAENRNLDFIDVFLTRPEDGTDRSFHASTTSTVWYRYNPGGTPLIDGEILVDALDAGASGEMQYGMLMGERSKLDAAAVEAILETAPAGVAEDCTRS